MGPQRLGLSNLTASKLRAYNTAVRPHNSHHFALHPSDVNRQANCPATPGRRLSRRPAYCDDRHSRMQAEPGGLDASSPPVPGGRIPPGIRRRTCRYLRPQLLYGDARRRLEGPPGHQVAPPETSGRDGGRDGMLRGTLARGASPYRGGRPRHRKFEERGGRPPGDGLPGRGPRNMCGG